MKRVIPADDTYQREGDCTEEKNKESVPVGTKIEIEPGPLRCEFLAVLFYQSFLTDHSDRNQNETKKENRREGHENDNAEVGIVIAFGGIDEHK